MEWFFLKYLLGVRSIQKKMCFQNPFSLIFLLFWHKINVFAVYVEKVSCEIPFFVT